MEYQSPRSLSLRARFPNGPQNWFDALLFDGHEEHQARYLAIMQAGSGRPLGIEFANEAGTAWAFIAEEMSEAERGSFRVQRFDRRGFYSHEVFKTLEEAVEGMADQFFVPAAGMLDQISQTSEWNRGVDNLALLFQLNSGQILFCEYIDAQKALDEKYAPSNTSDVCVAA